MLIELQATLEREIPMCRHMGLNVVGCPEGGLEVAMPLDLNRNHQQTAFAGSLNALCTIAGWGSMYLLLRQLETAGNIVIRRSSIRYHQPVATAEVMARCLPILPAHIEHFAEMLEEKGQAKLDLGVEVPGTDHAAVTFLGSYVVIQQAVNQ
jgi:thioesterase domain-containing protein